MYEPGKNLYDLDVQDLSLTILEGGRTPCESASWRSRREWSRLAKLYHPVSGRGWVEIGGKTTQLRPGRLYLIPPHVRISYGTPSKIVIAWLHFRLQSPHLDLRLGSLAHVHPFSPAVTRRWAPTCRLIERFMRERSSELAFRLHAMLLELAGLALAGLPPEDPAARALHDRFAPALRLLDDHAIEHPSLRDVARAVHLSPEHCHRLFRATFHTTPHHYAESRRMALARNLLSEGTLSVAEAAERCGYGDPFYFSRVFRRHFGVNPGRVRRGLAVLGPRP